MLTQDEAELYDRQIRLWGVSAQSRLRQSKVLMLGFNGVASEVAKILVLAGIDTLTIVDDLSIQNSDRTSNLFCRPSKQSDEPQFRTHATKTKLKTLNPLVKVNIENTPISSKKPEDFKAYDLVALHSFLTIDEIASINDTCRREKIKFYLALDYGFFGFMFNDLGPKFQFTYEDFVTHENGSSNKLGGQEKNPIHIGGEDLDDSGQGSSDDENDRPTKKRRLNSPIPGKTTEKEKANKVASLPYSTFAEMILLKNTDFNRQSSPILLTSIALLKFYSVFKRLPRSESPSDKDEDQSKLKQIFISLKDSLNIHESVMKRLENDWIQSIYGSLSPVCAILGGIAGQDMIRALSCRDIPLHNTFVFDGITMNGVVEKLGIVHSESVIAEPVVRDFMHIDDDDD